VVENINSKKVNERIQRDLKAKFMKRQDEIRSLTFQAKVLETQIDD